MVRVMDSNEVEADVLFLKPAGTPAKPRSDLFHFPTVQGLRLHLQWRLRGLTWAVPCMEPWRLSRAGARVTWALRSTDGRAEGQCSLQIRKTGHGYVLRARTCLDAPVNQDVEYVNLYPADIGNSWAGDKRFTATLHEVAPGRFLRHTHSPLTIVDHRGVAGSSGYGPHQDIPLGQGGRMVWSGETVTPMFRLLRSCRPTVTHTCDMWRDEHVILRGGVRRRDGRFHYEAEYELVALPVPQARRIERSAVDLQIGRVPQTHSLAAFRTGEMNAFTESCQPQFVRGVAGFFYALQDSRHLASWAPYGGPGGHGAIVLNTEDPVLPPYGQSYQSVDFGLGRRNWVHMRPMGYALHLFPGACMVASAKIRTEGRVRAWVELREARWGAFFGPRNPKRHTVASRIVTGDNWRRASARLTARDPGGCCMVFLCMEGKGRAMFSDLRVARSTD
jgi:hypothetical protein